MRKNLSRSEYLVLALDKLEEALRYLRTAYRLDAAVAQPVVHSLGKRKVVGSSPTRSSNYRVMDDPDLGPEAMTKSTTRCVCKHLLSKHDVTGCLETVCDADGDVDTCHCIRQNGDAQWQPAKRYSATTRRKSKRK